MFVCGRKACLESSYGGPFYDSIQLVWVLVAEAEPVWVLVVEVQVVRVLYVEIEKLMRRETYV